MKVSYKSELYVNEVLSAISAMQNTIFDIAIS